MRYLDEMTPEDRAKLRAKASDQTKRAILHDFFGYGTGVSSARRNQHPPDWDWDVWFNLGGRGSGKTRTGAETVRTWHRHYSPLYLIGPTAADVRDTMVEGESGILATSPPHEKPTYYPSKRRLDWPNGAHALLFSAEEPDRLRGPQCRKAWADEVCAWSELEDAWDNLMMLNRLGDSPQTIVTTTPKPSTWLKLLLADPYTATSITTTFDNRRNLSPQFFRRIAQRYEGTRIGRQELYAEILSDVEGALWERGLIDAARIIDKDAYEMRETLRRIVNAVDPSGSNGVTGDEIGIIVCGIDNRNPPHAYVLADETLLAGPQQWAERTAMTHHRWQADRTVYERNFGGEMVPHTIRTVDNTIPLKEVTASRGKKQRAEPIVALYEQGRVHHVGAFDKLEDEMCSFVQGETKESPNRMDALVWCLTELMGGKKDIWVF